MKLVVMVAALMTAAACGGGGSSEQIDAAPTGNDKPTGFTFTAVAERSFASFGWMGTFHDLEVPDGTPFSVSVTGCDDSGSCGFEGPVKPPGAVNRQRCLNHMSKTCTKDSDCIEGTQNATQRCVFIYDPPTGTPLVGAGAMPGACGWSYIPVAAMGMPATIRGRMNIETGELNIEDMNIIIALNGNSGTYRGACAECKDDKNPNDGMADGTCVVSNSPGNNETTSPDLGKKCDVHRFGNVTGYDKNYSMDCAPTVSAGVPDQQNAFGGKFTSSGYRVATSTASPNCTAVGFEGQKCLCGMCPPKAGRAPTACFTNADCGGDQCGAMPDACDPNPMPFDSVGGNVSTFDPMKAPNQCKNPATPDWFATAPNSCQNGCTWDKVKGVGTCISRLTKKTVGCYPEKDNAEVLAPGGSEKRGDVFIVDTAAARCTRSFPLQGSPAQQAATAAANAQLGLPGLTFQRRAFRVIPEHTPK